MRKFKRSQRVADQIKREMSVLVDAATAGQDLGLVTVTDVTISDDLRYAKVFVSALSDPTRKAGGGDSDPQETLSDRLVEFLLQRTKSLRSGLAARMTIKFIPELTFEYDSSVEEGMRIESILNKLNEKESEN